MSWWRQWRLRRAARHVSNWDNAQTGADLLALFIETNKLKKRKLP